MFFVVQAAFKVGSTHRLPMNVDDMMTQAANQYGNGFANVALGITLKALACQQDIRMFRFVGLYACAAHDLATAKAYYLKLSSNQQSAIEQRCQQEGLNIRRP